MGAQKIELQRVIHFLGGPGRRFGIGLEFTTQAGSHRPSGVEELPPRHRDQPAPRIPRRVAGPGPQGLDQGMLDSVLGRRETCSAADEDGDYLRGERPDEPLLHGLFRDGGG